MSDHLSSPKALADPSCDICDTYAFPSPERPGHLVLVMNVFPLAGPTALFSDAVLCRFRLRNVAIEGKGVDARFGIGKNELVFDCAFGEPARLAAGGGLAQTGTCTTPTGEVVTATVHDRNGVSVPGLRMFAGLVADPFIFELESIMETLKTGKMAFKKVGKNGLPGANVLGIVLEVECAKFLGKGSLVALVGETLAVGKRPVRLERVGRPEIKNIGMQWNGFDELNRDVDVRDLYNAEDAFAMSKDYIKAYRARLNANFRFFDGLDGKMDWIPRPNGDHPLVDLLLADFLVVDVTKPFAEDSYFEIEQAMLDGRPHETCGGRSLNDDFLDTYYTLLINAGKGPRISDGLDQATVPATNAFPYMARPNAPKAPSP